MGKRISLKVASLAAIRFTISSDKLFDSAMRALVSFKTESGVPIKSGGAWGGRLNVCGAMVEVNRGLCGVPLEPPRKGLSLIVMEARRGTEWKGARMSRVMEMNNSREDRKTKTRERARLNLGYSG